MTAGISLELRTGRWGEISHRVDLVLDPDTLDDLMGRVELSDEPFSVLLASPGLYGGYGDAVTIRKQKFALRASVAKMIAREVERKLIEMFGVNDVRDGYRKDQL